MKLSNKRVMNGAFVLLSVYILSFVPGFGGVRRTYSAGHGQTDMSPSVYLPVMMGGNSGEGSAGSVPVLPPEGAGWLDYLNYYRATAGVLPAGVNADWNHGAWLHSRYMVKNDYVGHIEDPQNLWYTIHGDTAAKASNLVATSNALASDREAIELWMQAPFHAVGILDPQLLEVGYGSYRDEDGGLQMGASLDVLDGLKELPAPVVFPIAWPADGMVIPLTSHFTEFPNPLSSCPGYQAPSGLPIILQIGAGDKVPDVTAYSFRQGDQPLDSCAFDETSYENPDPASRDLGRAVLNTRDAIVLIPRLPLAPGATYTVSITVNGAQYTWSFSISNATPQAGVLTSSTAESIEAIVK
jgi:hypothetical protein